LAKALKTGLNQQIGPSLDPYFNASFGALKLTDNLKNRRRATTGKINLIIAAVIQRAVENIIDRKFGGFGILKAVFSQIP
jgi:hypothetical protein